jgi:hypothetical protein
MPQAREATTCAELPTRLPPVTSKPIATKIPILRTFRMMVAQALSVRLDSKLFDH